MLPITTCIIKPEASITDEDVAPLHARLTDLIKVYRDVITCKQVLRLFYVAAVMEHVSLMLGDVEIRADQNVKGERVHVQGHFELLLKRGAKKLAVVVDRDGDTVRGMELLLPGLEALADVDQRQVTIGVATSFNWWIFFVDDDEQVRKQFVTLPVDMSVPKMEALKKVVGTIMALLVRPDQDLLT